MVDIVIPEWAVIIGIMMFALAFAGFIGAIYSRIGRMEGTISSKLNGTFSKLCDDVGGIKTDVTTLKTKMTSVQKDIVDIRRTCESRNYYGKE